MFGKMMNNFYYGKSGKGDFRKEDLPRNRWQLFFAMLRVRLSSLCRLNLMTIVAWIPMIIVLVKFIENLSIANGMAQIAADYITYLENGALTQYLTQEVVDNLVGIGIVDVETLATYVQSIPTMEQLISNSLLWMIPCIFITGPIQAGLAYITRNWSRDEHAFIWSDFKDAVVKNWKQGLSVSAITSLVPFLVFTCYIFYGNMANENNSVLFVVPQMLTVMLGLIWFLGLTFMYPMMVCYEVKFKTLIKNSVMLAIARLPHTVGIRLATMLPMLICYVIFYFFGTPYALLALLIYYVLFGFSLARFAFASYTNGIFDKYINVKIEGVKVNRGMADPDDDDDDEMEEDEGPSVNA